MNTCTNLGLVFNYTCESRRHYLKHYKIYILNQHTNFSFFLEWQRHFQMVSHKNSNLNVNEDFVMFLTSKLITCLIDGFTSRMKSQSIVYFLIGSAHINWILDLEGEVQSRWDLWTSGFQEGKGNVFFEVGQDGQHFSVRFRISKKTLGGVPTRLCLPLTSAFNVRQRRTQPTTLYVLWFEYHQTLQFIENLIRFLHMDSNGIGHSWLNRY